MTEKNTDKKLEGMFANMQIKKMNIDEKIRELSREDKTRLSKRVIDNLYSRDWCKSYGINYVTPDFILATKETYKQMFEKK